MPVEFAAGVHDLLLREGEAHGDRERRLLRDRVAAAREGLPRVRARAHPRLHAGRGGPGLRHGARSGDKPFLGREALAAHRDRLRGGGPAAPAGLVRASRTPSRCCGAASWCCATASPPGQVTSAAWGDDRRRRGRPRLPPRATTGHLRLAGRPVASRSTSAVTGSTSAPAPQGAPARDADAARDLRAGSSVDGSAPGVRVRLDDRVAGVRLGGLVGLGAGGAEVGVRADELLDPLAACRRRRSSSTGRRARARRPRRRRAGARRRS